MKIEKFLCIVAAFSRHLIPYFLKSLHRGGDCWSRKNSPESEWMTALALFNPLWDSKSCLANPAHSGFYSFEFTCVQEHLDDFSGTFAVLWSQSSFFTTEQISFHAVFRCFRRRLGNERELWKLWSWLRGTKSVWVFICGTCASVQVFTTKFSSCSNWRENKKQDSQQVPGNGPNSQPQLIWSYFSWAGPSCMGADGVLSRKALHLDTASDLCGESFSHLCSYSIRHTNQRIALSNLALQISTWLMDKRASTWYSAWKVWLKKKSTNWLDVVISALITFYTTDFFFIRLVVCRQG